MIFTEVFLKGAYLIDREERSDERGFFARVFCEREFLEHGLVGRFIQVNQSLSTNRGTLRGLHYQSPPKCETKLVRCTHGRFYDVIVDLRRGSSTLGQSYGAELSEENSRMLYVPKGFAHGFITLEDNTEAFYFVDEFYSPSHERVARWDDPQFNIQWPLQPCMISKKDAKAPAFSLDGAVNFTS